MMSLNIRHALVFVFIGLNMQANGFDDDSSLLMCQLLSVGAFGLSLVLTLREARFYCESPRLYKAYSTAASRRGKRLATYTKRLARRPSGVASR